jgi:hypothetical protein
MESRVLEISTSHPSAVRFKPTPLPFAFAFFVRFTRTPQSSLCPFVTFSKTFRLGVNPGGNLADNEEVLGECGVADCLWHKIYFERGREKDFSLYIDNKFAKRYHGPFVFQELGTTGITDDFLYYIHPCVRFATSHRPREDFVLVDNLAHENYDQFKDFRQVPYHSFVVIFQNSSNVDRLFDVLDAAEDKTPIFKVIGILLDCVPRQNLPGAFDRWLHSLDQIGRDCTTEYLVRYCQAALKQSQPEQIRTLFFDSPLITKLKTEVVVGFVDFLCEKLPENWSSLAHQNMFLFCLNYIAFFESDEVKAAFSRMLQVFGESVKDPQELFEVVLCSGLWSLEHDVSYRSPVLLVGSVASSCRYETGLVESMVKLPSFSTQSILTIAWSAVVTQPNLARRLLNGVFSRPELPEHVALVAEIVKGVGYDQSLFRAVVSRICAIAFEINEEYESLTIINENLLPVFFAFVVSVYGRPEARDKVFATAFLMLKDQWQLLCEDALVPSVLSLLGSADVLPMKLKLGDISGYANLSKDEVKELRKSFEQVPAVFPSHDPKLTPPVVESMSKFWIEVLLAMSTTKTFNQIICVFAEIAPEALTTILSGLWIARADLDESISTAELTSGLCKLTATAILQGTRAPELLFDVMVTTSNSPTRLGECVDLLVFLFERITDQDISRRFLSAFVGHLEYFTQNFPSIVPLVYNYHQSLGLPIPEGMTKSSDPPRDKLPWSLLPICKRQLLPNPLPNTVFNLSARLTIKTVWMLRPFIEFVNVQQRRFEARHARFLCTRFDRQPVRSYRIGSWALPDCTNLTILPSHSDLHPHAVPIRSTVFRFQSFEFATSDDDPPGLYRFSGSLGLAKGDWRMFNEVFRGAESAENCQLIRLDIKADCVIFRFKRRFRILAAAKLDGDSPASLVLLDSGDQALKSAVLDGCFGPFSMYCGHFVLEVRDRDIHQVLRYSYAGCQNAVELFTVSAGSMILYFPKPSAMVKEAATRQLASSVTQQWQEGKLSNLEYLLAVNSAGNRSPNDLSSYPVVPCVVVDWTTNGCPSRDLTKSIELIADRDPHHTQLHSAFRARRCHHKDVVSNPLAVTRLLTRLAPFCHAYWETHGGWDRGGRDFNSLSVALTVNTLTVHELLPELFILPECLVNVNRMVVDTTKLPFDLVLPDWCKDTHHFVELHRTLLESKNVHENLGRWIDHLFGVARAGREAEDLLNVFPAETYPDTPQKEPNAVLLECGQVPMQVFTTRHPDPLPVLQFTVDDIAAESASGCDMGAWSFSRGAMSLSVAGQTYNDRVLGFTKHISSGQAFCVVTTDVSLVIAFRLAAGKVRPHASVVVELPEFSSLFEKQLLCYSVSLNYITVWCLANSRVVKVVDLDRVTHLEVSQTRTAVFLARQTEVYQMSVSGTILRKFDLRETVSALAVCGASYWFTGLSMVVGTITGYVAFVGVDPQNHEFLEVRERDGQWAPRAVRRLALVDNDRMVRAYDL